MEYTMIPGLYDQEDQKVYKPKATLPKVLRFDGPNRLLGVMRMRALRVKPNIGCAFVEPYDAYFDKCYGPFSRNAEDKLPYGPLQSQFDYSTDPDGSNFGGRVATYGPDGYFQLLSTNRTLSEVTLRRLKADQWMQDILKTLGGGEMLYGDAYTAKAEIKNDADKGLFVLKLKDSAISESINYLKSKGLFPDKTDDSDDEMVFGDDDFPS